MPDYCLTLRPASIGTYPTRDAANADLHAEVIASHWPPAKLDNGRNHYATVRYPAPLTFDQMWRYDLQPVAAAELAHYVFWLWADRDAERAAWLENSYLITDRATLTQMLPDDGLAQHALVLLDAEWSGLIHPQED